MESNNGNASMFKDGEAGRHPAVTGVGPERRGTVTWADGPLRTDPLVPVRGVASMRKVAPV